MSEAIALIGGGEHARVVAATAVAAGWRVLGCYAPEPPSGGLAHLGDDADLAQQLARGALDAHVLCAVVGTAGGGLRRRVLARWQAATVPPPWASVIAPSAIVADAVAIGVGVFVGPGAILNPGARIEAHAIVNSGAIVEHDVVIGPGAHVAPGAVIGGGARIGADATIGLGSRIRDHVVVGDGAVVGMGAVVVADCPSATTVLGVPARIRAPVAGGEA